MSIIKKKTREELYDLFRQGAIPSGADFADLLKSYINILDDGLDVPDDDLLPIQVRGHSEFGHLFDYCDEDWTPQWRLSQKSAIDDEGLNLTSSSRSRLFIAKETGNVGLSTETPSAKLHLRQVGATDALRIDDEATDFSPFVVDSTGKLGVGIERPEAKVHINHTGSEDSFRVDDKKDEGGTEDDTPFVIKNNGNVGIGFSVSAAKVAINGGLHVGGETDPGAGNLQVANDITVAHDCYLGSSDEDTTIIRSQISSGSSALVVNDSLYVKQNLEIDGDVHIHSSLTVGNEDSDKLIIEGSVVSGNSTDKLEILDAVHISETLNVDGNVTIAGSLVSGNSTDKLEILDAVHISKTLNVDEAVTLGNIDRDTDVVTIAGSLVSGNSTDKLEILDAVHISKTLNVDEAVTLGNIDRDTDVVTIAGSLVSGNSTDKLEILDAVHISEDLNVTGSLKFNSGAAVNEFSIDGTLSGESDTAVPTEQAVKTYVGAYLPAGAIIMWSGSTPPLGWALCNGLNNTPNLTGKFIVAAGSGSYSVGDQGGVNQVSLTEAQMPKHNHSYNAPYSQPNGGLKGGAGGAGVDKNISSQAAVTNEKGSGESHENRPPYYALSYIMKS